MLKLPSIWLGLIFTLIFSASVSSAVYFGVTKNKTPGDVKGVVSSPEPTPTLAPTPIPTVKPTVIPSVVTTPKTITQQTTKPKQTVYLAHLGKAAECDSQGASAVQNASQLIYDYQQDQADCIRSKTTEATNCAANCQSYAMSMYSQCGQVYKTNEEYNSCQSKTTSNWEDCNQGCKSMLNICTNIPQSYKDNFDTLYQQYCQ